MKPQPRYHRGERIGGRYLVHQALLGGMGEVYLCLDLETNYPYALKTFQQRYLTDPHRLRRAFEQEVATWVALEKHPNIVRCFEMRTLDNQPFMILEWVAGEESRGTDLRGWLRRGSLDLKLALEVVIDIGNGLLHAQAKRPGLVHRDLKPENILMTQDGLAKLTDFGLAEITQAVGLVLDLPDTNDTGRQSMIGGKGTVGTPAYMAPEQWRGELLDERTDIYALGCIFYETLTGTPPFQVDFVPTTPQTFQQWLHSLQDKHERGHIPDLPITVPLALNNLLQSCLDKVQSNRPATLHELMLGLIGIYQVVFDQSPPIRPEVGELTVGEFTDRGITYYALQMYDAALADYNRAIELDPSYARVYTNRGLTYYALKQYEAALAEHTKGLTVNPSNARAYNNRGLTYGALEQYEQALADFIKAIELDSNYAAPHNNQGAIYAQLQKYEQALVKYNEALELDSKYVQAYTNRGVAHYELHEYEQALANYEQALALNPNFATYYYRGKVFQDLQQYEAALADYAQALVLDPGFSFVYLERALLYYSLGQYNEARVDLSQVLKLEPNNAVAYYYRGNIFHNLQQYEMALADFNNSLNFAPDVAETFTNRGVAHKALGRYEAALADFTQALEIDPTDIKSYISRGNTYQALHYYQSALDDYTQAIELDIHNANAYNSRGATYYALQEYEQALADFNRAIELDSNFAAAYLNLGSLLENWGMYQESISYFEKAAQLGAPQGAQYAARTRRRLGLESLPSLDPAQAAFAAFQQANSLPTMQQAVIRFPLLHQPDFIAAIEQVIAQQVPPEQRLALTLRLAWLRQIVNTQPRSTS